MWFLLLNSIVHFLCLCAFSSFAISFLSGCVFWVATPALNIEKVSALHRAKALIAALPYEVRRWACILDVGANREPFLMPIRLGEETDIRPEVTNLNHNFAILKFRFELLPQ
jgi:hypothetical protein